MYTQTYNEICTIETNIDDMNPEFYPFVMEKMMQQGAIDVFLTPIIMKKGRPGIKLTVLCKQEDEEKFSLLILQDTSSLGVRISYQNRRTLFREMITVTTSFGEITVKIARLAQNQPILRITPEFEHCKKIALQYGVPIQNVYQEALRCAEKKYSPKISNE
ncbi:nickel insertion protein [Desulforamulus aeronauticus]|uniref:TIGR00299 family protein n=1 Tax=Desulforamulus aeronauticus DSM 10349 TaxID=1121421 RepID=A0A1M6T9N6_9FIRM|nr:nickel insertion protein [Desulforamulus aeronauticus]SHK53559.1 Protein of unknown function DUF111 [Desulforamulus aeronauticus DSM 10349]